MTADAEIQLLRTDHAPALLAFERENRAYFARAVPDRGEEFFARFADMLADRLAEQAAGDCYFHVIVGDGGEVLGRINLTDVADGAADLGYRVAEHATGRGLATWAVRGILDLSANSYGLTALNSAARIENVASRRVLTRTGFTVTGEVTLSGLPGLAYTRDLADVVRGAGSAPGAAAGRRPR